MPFGTPLELGARSDQSGYFFKHFSSQTIVSENNKISFIAKKNDEIIVQFAPSNDNFVNLEITSDPPGAGGFNGQGQFSYAPNHTIHAVAKSGWVFSNWEGEGIDNHLSAITSINLDSNKTIKAVFISDGNNFEEETKEYLLFASSSDQAKGKVSGSGIFENKWSPIEAIAEDGYIFDYWEGDGLEDNNNTRNPTQILMDRDRSVIAHFKQTFSLTISSNPVNSGIIQGNGTYTDSPISIQATPTDGYLFSHWVGDGIEDPNNPSTSISLNQDKSIVAHFKQIFSLAISSNPLGSGNFEGNGTYTESTVLIKATPTNGYLFSHWEGDGITDPNNPSTSISLNQDKSIVAHFNLIPRNEFDLYVKPNNGSYGRTDGSGTYEKNKWVKISAFSNDGYEFSHWSGANFENSSSNETFVYIQTDANITAHFQAVSGVEGSNEIEEGWWDNPWFGFYWKINDTTWAFHEHLGWINIRSENDESTWVWVDKLGQWYWTAKQHYPYMQAGDGDMSWIWINLEKSNPYKLIYYDYGENAGWKQK